MPENHLSAWTPVEIGIHITNQAQTSRRFCSCWALSPVLIESSVYYLAKQVMVKHRDA